MSRKVFLSFLGAGNYSVATYTLLNKKQHSKFVQVAEVDILGINHFDQLFFLVTKTSKKKHLNDLITELTEIGLDKNKINLIEVSENLASDHQWKWFEKVLDSIQLNDTLTFDLTHGFRIMPIVISTAINFLQKIKRISLDAVYYGAFNGDQETSPVVDMRDFYIINEWADAVSRLVEDADTNKLAEISERKDNLQIPEFNDPDFIQALKNLTESIKNVEVQKIGQKAETALNIIKKKSDTASVTGKLMLNLIIDKFTSISITSNQYNQDYFKLQLELIKLLLDHALYMQAFTVMRELVASIGMLAKKNQIKTDNKKGRNKRTYAEVFLSMIRYDESTWEFKTDQCKQVENLRPVYDEIKQIDLLIPLQELLKSLVQYRNGFDHAWTSKTMLTKIHEQGLLFHKNLSDIIDQLIQNNIIQ